MKLKKILNKRGITQVWLANAIGVSSQTVNNWCNGHYPMSKIKKEAVAKALGINSKDLKDE